MRRKPAATSERASRIEPLTRLATGGMADIWLSREVGAAGLERLVVVKRLLSHLARDPEIVDMFVSEARFVARLVHPNVVQIHDLGQDEEGYFLVMEYVAGCSVRDLSVAALEVGASLPLEAALCIVDQACQGAHAAHELCDPMGRPLGLVHRDISPHNLMVGPSGEVKLLDFGIAKATAAAEATRTGSLKGKYGYMSPEQCAATHLDRRSDVFALGILAWELLTGARLFKRETEYATMHAIVTGDVPPASSFQSDLPGVFDTILGKALALDPADRWQTADAFRRALLNAAEAHGLRPSRDVLVATVGDLLGARLEELQRALRDAATSGSFPDAEHASRRAADAADEIATIVQGLSARAADAHVPLVEADAARTLTRRAPLKHDAGGAAAPSPTQPVPARSDGSLTGASDGRPRSAPGARSGRVALRVGLGVALALGVVAIAVLAVVRPFGLRATTPAQALASAPASASAPVAPLGPPLRFVVAPTLDSQVIRSELSPFLAWLGRNLERPVELSIAANYDDTGDAVAAGRGDFGLMPPLLFVRAAAREPHLQPLTVRLFDGSRASDGYLLVREDSTLTQAKDLRGHKICYVDRASTTGFLLPRVWMRKAGLVPDKDVEGVQSGDHLAAMRDLVDGKCDAASVYSGAYLTARQEGIAVGRLRVLAITGRVPQDVMVATPKMPAADVERLRAALLGFEPRRDLGAGRVGDMLGITGFAPFQAAEFDAIREAADSEGLLPRADAGAGH